MQKTKRECGSCQECCYVMAEEALNIPANTRCPHQIPNGCGIYEEKPTSCTAFRCAWLVGAMPKKYRPDKTHMVVFGSFLYMENGTLELIQCSVRKGKPIHGKILSWLKGLSYTFPVCVERDGQAAIYINGKKMLQYDSTDAFFHLKTNALGEVTSVEAVPKSQLPEGAESSIIATAKMLTVREDKPEYQANVDRNIR